MPDPAACPSCGAIAWYRDGVTIVEADDGQPLARRVMPSVLPNEPWSCAECGHELAAWLPLARYLDELGESAPVGRGNRGGFVA
jgi:hypothetical protein